MKFCPQCNHEFANKAREICPACGFALASTESPTLRDDDTAKVVRQDLALANAPTLQPPKAPSSSGENNSDPSFETPDVAGANDLTPCDFVGVRTISHDGPDVELRSSFSADTEPQS